MQAIILAAGFGMRCRPLTKNTPKALLSVNNYTLLDYQLWALKQINIKDLIIVTGHSQQSIVDHVDTYYRNDFNIQCIPNEYYGVVGKNGSEVSLLLASKYATDDKILILESDILYHPDLLKACMEQPFKNTFVSAKLSDAGDEVFLVVNDNMQVTFLGKQANEQQKEDSIGEFTGISCVTKETLGKYSTVVQQRFANDTATLHYEEVFVEITDKTPEQFTVRHCPQLAWTEIDTPKELSRARNEIWPKIALAYQQLYLEVNSEIVNMTKA